MLPVSEPAVAVESEAAAPARVGGGLFLLVLACLVFEYARPQETLPALGAVRVPALTIVVLALGLLASGRIRLWDGAPVQTRLFVVLLVFMALHVPFAHNNRWAYNLTFSMSLIFVVYLGIVTAVDTPARFKRLIDVWLVVHAYIAAEAIEHRGRGLGGFLGDQNDVAMTLNMAIPIAFFVARAERHPVRRILLFVLSGLLLVAQIKTLSRGGFVGLIAVGLVAWLRSPRKLSALVLIALLFGVAGTFAPETYWKEIESLRRPTEQHTAKDRFYMWEIGRYMFRDNPILGVGPGNFPYRFRQYEVESGNEDGFLGRSRSGRAAHSLYYTLLPELGLVGVALYGGMVFSTLALLSRLRGHRGGPVPRQSGADDLPVAAYARAFEASLAGFLASGAFISVLYYPNFWFLMGFVVALSRSAVVVRRAHTPAH